MAISDTPSFWYEKPGLAAWAMAPAALAYGAVSGHRMAARPSYAAQVPVICIGNFIAGGAGKTPTAIALARIARARGLVPGFLSRGYGGTASGAHRVDADRDTARTVGDEALLLAAHGPCVVSSDRVAGAKALEAAGVSLIIMDDGFQNPSLHKDFTLVVVDSNRSIGNGFVHPAGPLRAPLKVQLARASAVLVVGKSQGGVAVVRHAARMAKPVMTGLLQVPNPARWRGVKVLAYCGIGDPDKFFRSLEAVEAVIVERRTFPDHHPYEPADCDALLEQAAGLNAALATTEKDKVRLAGAGERQRALHDQSFALPVELIFENPKRGETIIDDAFKAFAKRTGER